MVRSILYDSSYEQPNKPTPSPHQNPPPHLEEWNYFTIHQTRYRIILEEIMKLNLIKIHWETVDQLRTYYRRWSK